jgi:hypothetical protein
MPQGNYKLHFPGSEDDVEFWQCVVVYLMKQLRRDRVHVDVKDLAGNFDLELSVIPELEVLILNRTPVTGTEVPFLTAPAQGSKPS